MTTTPPTPAPWNLPFPPRRCEVCGVEERMSPSGARIELPHDDAKHTLAPVAQQPVQPPARTLDDDDDDAPAPARAPIQRQLGLTPIGALSPLQRAARYLGERDDEE